MQAALLSPTHVARLNGQSIQFNVSEYDAVVPQFVEQHGPGVPQITALARPDADGTAAPLTRLIGHAPVSAVVGPGITRPDAIETVATGARTPLAAPPVERGSTIDGEGQARSMIDDTAARAAGFAPERPLYSRGTMVLDIGVTNARAARAEHDAMPSVEAATGAFLDDVIAEKRRDVSAVKKDLRLDKQARVVVLPGRGERLLVNERAFGSFCSRMGFGGGDYLARCWPELRAINVNRWADAFGKGFEAEVGKWTASGRKGDAPTPEALVLRTRDAAGGGREVFGVVSESYTAFDVDKVAEALRLAMPPDAKLRTEYDGFRVRFDVLFHSTVQPEKYVAGEFFRGGITIRTDDTGGGSLRGSSFIEQNLCLNLIIIDKATQPLFALRHIGSVERLAAEFRVGRAKAKDSLQHFLVQWGYAQADDLVAAATERGEFADGRPVSLDKFFEGFANGAIERDLVPLRSRRAQVIDGLETMFLRDASGDGPASGTVTRAGFVNALTRYAHEVESDPWKGAEIERAASSLLWPRRGTRLPEIPFEVLS